MKKIEKYNHRDYFELSIKGICIAGQGVKMLKSYAKGQKHKSKTQQKTQTAILFKANEAIGNP